MLVDDGRVDLGLLLVYFHVGYLFLELLDLLGRAFSEIDLGLSPFGRNRNEEGLNSI